MLMPLKLLILFITICYLLLLTKKEEESQEQIKFHNVFEGNWRVFMTVNV